MARHNEIGAWGEQMARDYLRRNGYTVFDANTHVGHKEIDIIATKDNIIAFIEVKTRSSSFKDPTDAIDYKKIKRLTRAADSFLQTHNIIHEPQFDIITVIGTPDGEHKLTHYPDAFMPPLAGAW